MDQIFCPKCHANKAEKLLSVFASEMKGSSETIPAGMSCGPNCGCHHQ
jgi:hypothetical protein